MGKPRKDSLRQRALKAGLCYQTVRWRIRHGGFSEEKALSLPPRQFTTGPVKPGSIHHAARLRGLNAATVYSRMYSGMSLTEALTAIDKRGRPAQIRAFLLEKKSRPCLDCGGSFPQYNYTAMEFDHVPSRGKKLFTITGKDARGKSLEDIKIEVAKCDVVCSNCHAIRTASRRPNAWLYN